jgi:hypothetical protein
MRILEIGILGAFLEVTVLPQSKASKAVPAELAHARHEPSTIGAARPDFAVFRSHSLHR